MRGFGYVPMPSHQAHAASDHGVQRMYVQWKCTVFEGKQTPFSTALYYLLNEWMKLRFEISSLLRFTSAPPFKQRLSSFTFSFTSKHVLFSSFISHFYKQYVSGFVHPFLQLSISKLDFRKSLVLAPGSININRMSSSWNISWETTILYLTRYKILVLW